MTNRTPAAAQRGFTLLELIVAAGILALIAVFSWRGLDALIREREAIAASQSAIDVMQRSFARIERDALLAGDAELDGAGTMRLIAAGTSRASSVDGAPSATVVVYRLVDGTLTRIVDGVDHAPLAMIEHVTSLKMEAWAPVARGGGRWINAKGPAVEAAPVDRTGSEPQPATNPQNPSVGYAVPTGQPAPLGTTPPEPQAPGQPAGSTGNAPPTARAPVPAATGIRMTLALANGTNVVRSFVVGGG